MDDKKLQEILDSLPKLGQRQYDTQTQVNYLIAAANKLGLLRRGRCSFEMEQIMMDAKGRNLVLLVLSTCGVMTPQKLRLTIAQFADGFGTEEIAEALSDMNYGYVTLQSSVRNEYMISDRGRKLLAELGANFPVELIS